MVPKNLVMYFSVVKKEKQIFLKKVENSECSAPLKVKNKKNQEFLVLRKTYELSFYPIFKIFIPKNSENILISKNIFYIFWGQLTVAKMAKN